MSILSEIDRVSGHINNQESLIEELIALVESKATGGKGNNIAWGITTVSSNDVTTVTVPHNLGVTPKFAAIFSLPYSSTAPDVSSGAIFAVAYQTVGTTLSSAANYAFYLYNNTSGVLTSKRLSISGNSTYVQRGTTTDVFKNGGLGVNFIAPPAAVRYLWVAVGSD